MSESSTNSSDFMLGCAIAGACGDGPIGGRTAAEGRSWRFGMGVLILAVLGVYMLIDWACRLIFG